MSYEIKMVYENNEDHSHMVIYHDGVFVRDERDGGEPEDRYFERDWWWVSEALKEAYQFGRQDAIAEANALNRTTMSVHYDSGDGVMG